MVKTRLDNIKSGMVVAEDVQSESGFILISADTVIKERHIAVLRDWGISEVAVRDNSGAPVEKPPPPPLTVELQAATEQAMRLFVHNDKNNPVIAELYRLCIDRLARQERK